MSCPICEKRKAKRFCPAKGEKICAVCCGTEREVSIDCPADCPYLIAARKYEDAHRKPVPPEEVPYPDVEFRSDLVHERRVVVSGLAYHILKAAAEHRTLGSGILYEKPPDAPEGRAIYELLAHFLGEAKKQEAERVGWPALKDSEIFHLLVFLLRVGRHHTNGRPRSRAFLDFLRAQFPRSAELEREAPRIVMP